MAYTTAECTPEEMNVGIQSQASVIQLRVAEGEMKEDPYPNLFLGGTRKAYLGETIEVNIPDRVVLNQSMTAPETVSKSELCGVEGPAASYGSTNFTATIAAVRGQGPDICVQKAFYGVDGSLEAQEMGLVDIIKEHMSADARYNALVLSGHKYVHVSTEPFLNCISGGDRQIQVDFPNIGEPDTYPNFRRIRRVIRYIKDYSDVKRYEDGSVRVICGEDLLDLWREETNMKVEMLAMVGGNDNEVRAGLKKFSFTPFYRGISTAIDPRPLRFNEVNNDNMPVWIEPYTEVATDNGTAWRVSDEYKDAAYECGFIFFRDTLRRLVPESLTKIGKMSFDPQYVTGELIWSNLKSRGCNERGEFGHFLYEFQRAWEPVTPWGICPFLYKRCDPDDAGDPCDSVYPEGDANLPDDYQR